LDAESSQPASAPGQLTLGIASLVFSGALGVTVAIGVHNLLAYEREYSGSFSSLGERTYLSLFRVFGFFLPISVAIVVLIYGGIAIIRFRTLRAERTRGPTAV